jgi:predicted kinase
MLHDNMHASGTEALVLRARDSLVRSFLMSGVNVIVDDTNLAPYHETSLRSIAEACGAAFRVQDFTDIDVEECIRRDARRTATVGPDVIREMHHTHLAT